MTITPGGFIALRQLKQQLAHYLNIRCNGSKAMLTIEVKIKGNQAIVRKVLSYPAKRYALTKDGEWAFIPEGQAFPEQCILPVVQHQHPQVNIEHPDPTT